MQIEFNRIEPVALAGKIRSYVSFDITDVWIDAPFHPLVSEVVFTGIPAFTGFCIFDETPAFLKSCLFLKKRIEQLGSTPK
jgi:hypothetical protein